MATDPDYRKALRIRSPFWRELSPTAVKERIEQLLTAPNSAELVQALSPVEFLLLLKEAPERRLELLQLAQPHQIRTAIDLDCWYKDTIQESRVLTWLMALQESGEEVFVQAMAELDEELLLVTLRRYIRVHAALPPEEEPEPVAYDEVLANELYRVTFLEAEDPHNEQIIRLLRFLRATDLDRYHSLMQGVMWGQDSELEEWAYRWKSGRLQDEGFPDYYDALETYRLVDLQQPLPSLPEPPYAPGIPASAQETGLVPSYAWSLTPPGSLLAEALQEDFAPTTLARLCWEMVYLCNRELVIDQVDFADAAAVRTSLQRVHAYLNIGLEYLRGNNTQQLVALLEEYPLLTICQVGYTLIMRLYQRAHRLQTHLDRTAKVRHTLPGLARRVVDGLLQRPPLFFIGLETPGAIGYRAFLQLHDVQRVEPLLTRLERDPAYGLQAPCLP